MGTKGKQWIGICAICGKAWADYASNRTRPRVPNCSARCRAKWTSIMNSSRLGGAGIVGEPKAVKDARLYRKTAAARRAKAKAWYYKNREAILAGKQAATLAVKKEIVAAYGGKCQCCGESHIEFLTIDHMNGDGTAHRAVTGKGRKIYQDLKNRGFPQDGYQLLCLNCNIALGFYGYCPHNPDQHRAVNHVPRKPGRPRTVK